MNTAPNPSWTDILDDLDVLISAHEAEDQLSKISALSDAPENARSLANKADDASSTGARAVVE